MIVIDWAARFLEAAFDEDYIVGVFRCQLIGVHGNDRWFPARRMKRTYLRDDDGRSPIGLSARHGPIAPYWKGWRRA